MPVLPSLILICINNEVLNMVARVFNGLFGCCRASFEFHSLKSKLLALRRSSILLSRMSSVAHSMCRWQTASFRPTGSDLLRIQFGSCAGHSHSVYFRAHLPKYNVFSSPPCVIGSPPTSVSLGSISFFRRSTLFLLWKAPNSPRRCQGEVGRRRVVEAQPGARGR